jgi:hypothetical protein
VPVSSLIAAREPAGQDQIRVTHIRHPVATAANTAWPIMTAMAALTVT